MFYEIENHAKAFLEVRRLKRALRESEDNLREYETHQRAQGTTSPPKAVIVDGFAVTLDHKGHKDWEYTVGEVVTS